MGTAVMSEAKRKTTTPKARDRAGEKPTALTIKGSIAWREWVDRGAKHCRTDVAKLVDAAIVDYLKARAFTEEAPAR
ncbi:MAG: hypothetical protein ACLQGP_26210 [Isosphaeraceae bacterium]